MLPSEADTPPWAATVCERVGKTLVQAGDGQTGAREFQRGTHARAAGADDDDIELAHGNIFLV